MSFISDIRQFTLATFADYLASLPPPDWPGVGNPRGSTGHNTYIPTVAQWRGKASMESMIATYTAKSPPWDRGPHFYLALGSPNPKNDGIWQMTPPTIPGIHGVTCNPSHFGIELVGNFQSRAPSLPQQQLLINVLVLLHTWAHIGAVFNMHRDCVARTCPGDAFYALKPQLIAQLAARLNHAGPYRVCHPQAIFEAPRPDARVALNDQAEVHTGDTVIIDEVKAGWAHLANHVGFVPLGILERL
jgi:hypothetical protein